MRTLPLLFTSLFASVLAVASAPSAFAQQPPPPPPAAAALAPPPAPATTQQVIVITPPAQPQEGYATPMQQLVQPSYVPQSVAMSGPAIMDWKEDRLVPPGYHPDTRMRKGPIIAGAVLFGTMYTFALIAGAAQADGGDKSSGAVGLYVPVLGPFISMGSSSSAVGTVFLGIDGLAQAAGAALLIYGLASPKPVVVRNDLGKVEIMPTPMVLGRDGNGFGVVGRF